MKQTTKSILLRAAAGVLIALNALGLFFLICTKPATSLTLSETSITLKMDEGRPIAHAIEPYNARHKLLHFSVSWSEEIIAWVDELDEMIVAVSPGTCTIAGAVDEQKASVSVTVTEETILAGTWLAPDGETLTLDNALNGAFYTADGTQTTAWVRTAFADGECANPFRFVKLTPADGPEPVILYYDRLNDTLRMHFWGADAKPDLQFTRG